MPERRLIVLACVLLAGTALPASGQLSLPADPPYAGRPYEIGLTAPIDTLVARYRPNSSVFYDEAFLIPPGATTFTWTPAEAGVVALRAAPGEAWQNVSVRFDRYKPSGILILLLAGSILFGGAAFAFRKLFQDDAPVGDPAVRPDT